MLVSDFIKVLPNKAGVYKFFVYSLNKYYIGESCDIKRRVQEHLNGNGKGSLYIAITENSIDDLGFEILSYEESRDRRIAIEQHYKCYYGFDNLLNSISTKESGSVGKAVLAFTKAGNFVKRYTSVSEAASSVNRKIATLSDGCAGKAIFVGGYTWIFEDEYTEQKLQQRLLSRKIRDLKKKHFLNTQQLRNKEINQKPVLGKSENDELIFMSITDASKYLNTSLSNISACCLGKQKRIKSYEWSYINE